MIDYDFPNLVGVLKEYGERLSKAMKDNLERNGTNASKGLYDSIKFEVGNPGSGEYEVNIRLADYWKYVEKGTKAHWPPKKAIMDWIEVKPIIPEVRGGVLPTVEQLAFLIGRAIAGKSPNQKNLKNPNGGTSPQPFLEPAAQEIFNEFQSRIYLAVVKDLEDMVDTWFAEIKNIKM